MADHFTNNPTDIHQQNAQKNAKGARFNFLNKASTVKQTKKRWGFAKHGISGIMNAATIAGIIFYTSPELPKIIKNSISATENPLASSLRPRIRPTR